MPDSRKVLIPDASNRAALAAIRSLGRRGCEVYAGTADTRCLGGMSRYAHRVVKHPSPARDPAGFAKAVAALAERFGIGTILPAADVPLNALSDNLAALPDHVRVLAPTPESLRIAHDKIRLVELCRTIGVPVPDSVVTDAPLDDTRVAALGFPLILKPRTSRFLRDGRWREAGVVVVTDRQHLAKVLAESAGAQDGAVLLQRWVPGEGRGIFLLAKDGEPRCVFAHRRIREKPPWGGVSTLCESARPEPTLLDYATRLVRALRWSGVAMVEFRWDPATGQSWLMEINGRFWGSMQLAIACGADFPWLLYEQEVLCRSSAGPTVRDGVRLWWVLGDLDHFLIRLRRGGVGEIGAAARDLRRTRQERSLHLDTFEVEDPVPFLFELGSWVTSVARGARRLVA
jgi:predicted ATP-grasp superfamily ATP-dependent carboligase